MLKSSEHYFEESPEPPSYTHFSHPTLHSEINGLLDSFHGISAEDQHVFNLKKEKHLSNHESSSAHTVPSDEDSYYCFDLWMLDDIDSLAGEY